MELREIMTIDKPKGITSYTVIRILKRKMGHLKMGHAGTLDPMATGLMIIGVDKGTKKLNEYLKLSKTYEAEITLGIKTDTSDITGKILEEKNVPKLSEKEIKSALKATLGEHEFPVSIYSALKKDGKPLYKYAREGKTIESPLRKMKINIAKLQSFDGKVIRAVFDVESGTYIRSIAEEIGKKLGTVATLSNLRRTRIGDFNVVDAQIIVDPKSN